MAKPSETKDDFCISLIFTSEQNKMASRSVSMTEAEGFYIKEAAVPRWAEYRPWFKRI